MLLKLKNINFWVIQIGGKESNIPDVLVKLGGSLK